MPPTKGRVSDGLSAMNPTNLYCASCEGQIGVVGNEWVRLTATYARLKEQGIQFGTETGKKTKIVPEGPTQEPAEGCEMSEIFCQRCSTTLGHYCRSASSEDKLHLVDQRFYKLSRVFLKDSQTHHLVDPVFGYGDDIPRPLSSHNRRTSSKRWSDISTTSATNNIGSRRSNGMEVVSRELSDSPDEFEEEPRLHRYATVRSASMAEVHTPDYPFARPNLPSHLRPSSSGQRQYSAQPRLQATPTTSSRQVQRHVDNRATLNQQCLIKPSMRADYPGAHVSSRALSTQPGRSGLVHRLPSQDLGLVADDRAMVLEENVSRLAPSRESPGVDTVDQNSVIYHDALQRLEQYEIRMTHYDKRLEKYASKIDRFRDANHQLVVELAQDRAQMEEMRAELASTKMDLEKFKSTSISAPHANSTLQDVSGAKPESSLGKRKRRDKHGPNRRSTLQNRAALSSEVGELEMPEPLARAFEERRPENTGSVETQIETNATRDDPLLGALDTEGSIPETSYDEQEGECPSGLNEVAGIDKSAARAEITVDDKNSHQSTLITGKTNMDNVIAATHSQLAEAIDFSDNEIPLICEKDPANVVKQLQTEEDATADKSSPKSAETATASFEDFDASSLQGLGSSQTSSLTEITSEKASHERNQATNVEADMPFADGIANAGGPKQVTEAQHPVSCLSDKRKTVGPAELEKKASKPKDADGKRAMPKNTRGPSKGGLKFKCYTADSFEEGNRTNSRPEAIAHLSSKTGQLRTLQPNLPLLAPIEANGNAQPMSADLQTALATVLQHLQSGDPMGQLSHIPAGLDVSALSAILGQSPTNPIETLDSQQKQSRPGNVEQAKGSEIAGTSAGIVEASNNTTLITDTNKTSSGRSKSATSKSITKTKGRISRASLQADTIDFNTPPAQSKGGRKRKSAPGTTESTDSARPTKRRTTRLSSVENVNEKAVENVSTGQEQPHKALANDGQDEQQADAEPEAQPAAGTARRSTRKASMSTKMARTNSVSVAMKSTRPTRALRAAGATEQALNKETAGPTHAQPTAANAGNATPRRGRGRPTKASSKTAEAASTTAAAVAAGNDSDKENRDSTVSANEGRHTEIVEKQTDAEKEREPDSAAREMERRKQEEFEEKMRERERLVIQAMEGEDGGEIAA